MSDTLLISDPKVVAAITGAISAVVVSVINNLWNSRKTKFEIEKLKAETEKIKAETIAIIEDDNKNLVNSIKYESSNKQEVVLYESSGISEFDVKFNQTKCYANNAPYGEQASGELAIKGGVISISRNNKDGRLELVLRKYIIDGIEHTFIPNNPLLTGERKIHLKFSAKSTSGRQNIRAVAKDNKENKWLAQVTKRIESNEWFEMNAYFRIPANRDAFIRIDNENVDVAPTSYQIKDIRLTERK